MAKRCIKIAGTQKVKAHIRCYNVSDKEKKSVKGNKVSDNTSIDQNKSKDKITYRNPSVGNYENVKITKGEVFGKISDNDAINHMKAAGIPADTNGFISISKMRNGKVLVEVDTDDFYMKRYIDQDSKTITNYEFKLKGDPYKYRGNEVFKRQVEESSSQGYKKIETFAAKGEDYNGYYTWARLGYKMDKTDAEDLAPLFKKSKYKSVEDAMTTQEGRDWWKSNGEAFNATFDLNTNSYSRKTLNEYKSKD